MTDIKLNVLTRSKENDKIQLMQADGLVPAVIYGAGVKTRNLKVKQLDIERVFEQAGESNLINLTIDSEDPIKVIVKEIQKNHINDKIIHIDLYQVDMNKKIVAEIPLHFIDSSKAVSELGGTLVKNMDAVKVKCLPGDLVGHIDVSLSVLENFSDAIRITDLIVPSGITAIGESNEMVASVIEQREVEEVKEEEVKEEEIKEEGKEEEGKEEKKDEKEKEEKK